MKFQLKNNDYVKSNIEYTKWQLLQTNIISIKNLEAVVGKDLANKLIKEAGSLKKLALMRPETIYKLGSKKFFSTGMKKTSAGLITEHKSADKKALSKEISVAARKDYFK